MHGRRWRSTKNASTIDRPSIPPSCVARTICEKVVITVPCLMVGGTEIQTLDLARALTGGGYKVTVCVYFEHDPVMLENFRAQGLIAIIGT